MNTKKYSDRIYGIEFTGSDKLVILNVYLPYDNNSFESLGNCRQILEKYLLLYKTVTPTRLLAWVILTMILSADLERSFMYFTADNALQISDGILRGYQSGVFTYISEAHGTVSWLDHVVCTVNAHRHVLSCDTLDDIAFGDHIPVRIIYYSILNKVIM